MGINKERVDRFFGGEGEGDSLEKFLLLLGSCFSF